MSETDTETDALEREVKYTSPLFKSDLETRIWGEMFL